MNLYRLLLGSGGLSTVERQRAWKEELDDFLGPVRKILFLPYAGKDYDAYVQRMITLGFQAGRELEGIHKFPSPGEAVRAADAIFVGGGNSFRLLATLYQHDLLEPIREKVRAGTPYIGISAGTNMACPTMRTTNDMPICEPPSLSALGFVPFQINPHYFKGPLFYEQEGAITKYGGETRDDRLREFHEENDIPVVGLGEGTILRVEGRDAVLKGVGEARLFRKGHPAEDRAVGALFSDLFR